MLLRKTLKIIGVRSSCCGAKITAWHHNNYHCSACGARVAKLRKKVIPHLS